MSIACALESLHAELPTGTRLVAVSKFHPVPALQEAYEAGQRIFGESRVQELCEKQPLLPSDIEWHFIGHLQTNKVKQIVPFVALIHGVDSVRLLREIDKEGSKIGRRIPCLLQIHVAQEETKFGFSPQEALELLTADFVGELPWIEFCGIMGMASLTDDEGQISAEFGQLKDVFDGLKSTVFNEVGSFKELSMGMSGDYPIAVRRGSTLVRIGTRIFGEREY